MGEIRQERYRIGESEDRQVQRDVDDALAATKEERMAALVSLLDTAVELWISQGLSRDKGLLRFPGCTQERRRGLCRDRP